LKITRGILYDAQPNHNKTGKRTMRMFSEKVVALLLAVVISGTAFNTFIV
jgi:hypothetical protein